MKCRGAVNILRHFGTLKRLSIVRGLDIATRPYLRVLLRLFPSALTPRIPIGKFLKIPLDLFWPVPILLDMTIRHSEVLSDVQRILQELYTIRPSGPGGQRHAAELLALELSAWHLETTPCAVQDAA